MRRARLVVIGAIAGAALMLASQAIADIPDTEPSMPDPAHTFYVCVSINTLTPYKPMQALDKSQGNGQCPFGWVERKLVPAIPTTTLPGQ
jgi:hypothetical protein